MPEVRDMINGKINRMKFIVKSFEVRLNIKR